MWLQNQLCKTKYIQRSYLLPLSFPPYSSLFHLLSLLFYIRNAYILFPFKNKWHTIHMMP